MLAHLHAFRHSAVPALLLALAAVSCGPAASAPTAPAPPSSSPASTAAAPLASPSAPLAGTPTAIARHRPPPAVAVARASTPSTVVVRAARASGRSPELARTLRRLLALRRGNIELATGYQRVSLSVTELLEGTLDDPDYARRPVGVNVLPVILLDEAAHAAPEGLDGFEGVWRLTRLDDGSLVAQAITDTPFPPSRATERRALLELTRRQLQSPAAEPRLAALDTLQTHHFCELVPDVIELLSAGAQAQPPVLLGLGKRSMRSQRLVRDAAAQRLRDLLTPFGAEMLPFGDDPDAWRAAWRRLLADPAPLEAPFAGGTTSDLLRVAANQTWSQLVAPGDGHFALGVARLQVPIDGHTSGVALTDVRGGGRRWAFGVRGAGEEPDGLDAAVGPRGVGVLFADTDDTWRFAVSSAGASAASPPVQILPASSHAALAGSPRGFAILEAAEGTKVLRARRLDANGRPQGPPHLVPIPGTPATDVHRGLHPLALIALPAGGWLGAVETPDAVVTVSFDDAMRPLRSAAAVATHGFAQPVLAATRDRVMLAWTAEAGHKRRPSVAVAFYDASDKLLEIADGLGDDVRATSRPVVLPDGSFALAWIETVDELRVARWDHDGRLLANLLLHRGDLSLANVALTLDGDAVVVAYQDATRYPFTLRARRVDIADLR